MGKHLLACYIRLSQEDEKEGESNSVANQRALLQNFIQSSPELGRYQVVEFCDDGYSGTHFDRPAVQALLQEVRAGNVGCIVVKDLSRFGRNYIEVGEYLEHIFPFLGVRFISVNDHFDSGRLDASGGLELGFRNLLYSLYSRDLSQKIRTAKKTRMERGEFLSSFPPFGYLKSPQNPKKLVVDPEAAAIVQDIFQMAEEGKNAVEIAASLNARQIPTPVAYKKRKGCRHPFSVTGGQSYWRNTTVLAILRDQRYTGKLVSGKSRVPIVGGKGKQPVPQREWIVVPNTHEPIVSEELFDSVQKRFSASKRGKRGTDPRPLAGKVKCGVCRRAMRRSHSASVYYVCESHRYLADSNCPKEKIWEKDLAQALLSAIHTQMAVFLDMENKNDTTSLTERKDRLQAALAKLNASKKIFYEQYKSGLLDFAGYTRQKETIRRQTAELEAQIAKLEAIWKNRSAELCFKDIRQHPVFAQLSRKMADALVDSIYVHENQVVDIVWNFRDDLVLTEHPQGRWGR